MSRKPPAVVRRGARLRPALFCIALAGVLPAQTPEPAGLIPAEVPIFVEVRDPSALARMLGGSPALSRPTADDKALLKTLQDIGGTGTRTLALGVTPAVVGSNKWVVVADSSDPQALLAAIHAWTGPHARSATIAPFFVVADGDKTLAEVAELAGGKGKSFLDRAESQPIAASQPAAPGIRFVMDVQSMFPRALRSVRNSSNLWSVLFGCHVNQVIKTVGVLSGTVTTSGGVRASVAGDIKAADSRAVTEGAPTQTVFAAPASTGFRISVPRNLSNFWARRRQLVPDAALATLTKLEQIVPSLVPGWTVERLLAQMGEAFDLYIAPGGPTNAEGKRVPAMALVIALGEPQGGADPAALRTFLRIVSATVAGEEITAAPPEEKHSHRGIDLFVSQATPNVIAMLPGRVIVANQEAFAQKLIDAALDGKPEARIAGDDIIVDGAAAAQVIAEARPMLATGWLADRLGAEAKAQTLLDSAEAVLARAKSARLRFDLVGKLVRLDIEIDGPALFLPEPAQK